MGLATCKSVQCSIGIRSGKGGIMKKELHINGAWIASDGRHYRSIKYRTDKGWTASSIQVLLDTGTWVDY